MKVTLTIDLPTDFDEGEIDEWTKLMRNMASFYIGDIYKNRARHVGEKAAESMEVTVDQ